MKAVYLAIGVTMNGDMEVLGLWLARTEGAKFWLPVVTELKNHGVRDILIAGLKGFATASVSTGNWQLVQTTPVVCSS